MRIGGERLLGQRPITLENHRLLRGIELQRLGNVALHQRNLGERRAEEIVDARVHVVDAQPRVMRERVAVARLDQQHEEREIAPEIEHPRHA